MTNITANALYDNPALRLSDTDRNAAASIISDGFAHGRLSAKEHSDRLDAIYSAKTRADLIPLLQDLPIFGTAGQLKPHSRPIRVRASRKTGRIRASFGVASRTGAWQPKPVINIRALVGLTELDFRNAVLPCNEIILNTAMLFGVLEVTVPPGMYVADECTALFSLRESSFRLPANSVDTAQPRPDQTVLRIQGRCVLGVIEVTYKSASDTEPEQFMSDYDI
jgi:Domain of unknown function (DUF1707)/Cell wall-active antibiotics response 4TMS YvqF